MLTVQQLDNAPRVVVGIVSRMEQDIVNDMAVRIAKLSTVTDPSLWDAYRREAVAATRVYIMQQLNKAQSEIEAQLLKLFEETITQGQAVDDDIFRAAGYAFADVVDSPYMQQIIQAGYIKTLNEYRNLTLTTATTATQQFERALDMAYHGITSGNLSYQQAIVDGIRALTHKGLTAIQYPSGWVDYLDVAFRRAALTGVNQTAAELQLQRMSELGADLVETTAHHGARTAPAPGPENHAWWQGRWFTLSPLSSKYPDFYAQTGYGTGPGLCGWNCRHSFFPVIEGLSDRVYDLDYLRNINNQTVTYNGTEMTLYEATQKQRYIERQIRRWKREDNAMAVAASNTADPKERARLINASWRAYDKVQQWQELQRDFLGQTGLSRDYFRERGGKQLP